MLWRVGLVLIAVFTACTIRFHKAAYPHFEFSPELEGSEVVLKYDKWTVTRKEFFDTFPEFRPFHEEFSALQTAVALQNLIKDIGNTTEIQITGCSREACLMTFNRLGTPIDEKKLVFKDAQGKNTISAGGKTYMVQQLPLNHMDLARLQTSYYIQGQGAAEQLLIKKMISESEKKTLTENLTLAPEEFKKYIRKYNIDPKAIGLRGVQKIKDALLLQKEHEIYKNYANHRLYKRPVLSIWKKPNFYFDRLPEKPFVTGRGRFKLIIFSPYDCRACLEWNQELPQFMVEDIEIKYFPAVSDDGRKSSLAFYDSILCLTEQRSDIIWSVLAKFKNIYSRATLEEKFTEFISQEKLDQKKYAACLVKNKYEQRLEHYQKFSQTLGANSFPVVAAGGFVFSGDIRAEDVKEALAAEDSFLAYKVGSWFSR